STARLEGCLPQPHSSLQQAGHRKDETPGNPLHPLPERVVDSCFLCAFLQNRPRYARSIAGLLIVRRHRRFDSDQMAKASISGDLPANPTTRRSFFHAFRQKPSGRNMLSRSTATLRMLWATRQLQVVPAGKNPSSPAPKRRSSPFSRRTKAPRRTIPNYYGRCPVAASDQSLAASDRRAARNPLFGDRVGCELDGCRGSHDNRTQDGTIQMAFTIGLHRYIAGPRNFVCHVAPFLFS